jgi:hypothetical protein
MLKLQKEEDKVQGTPGSPWAPGQHIQEPSAGYTGSWYPQEGYDHLPASKGHFQAKAQVTDRPTAPHSHPGRHWLSGSSSMALLDYHCPERQHT